MRVLILFIGTLALAFSLGSYAQDNKNERLLAMWLPELDATTTWLIEEGVILDSHSGEETVQQAVRAKFEQLRVSRSIGRTHDFRYLLNVSGIHYEIFKLHEIETSNTLLEYWVVKSSSSLRDLPRRCEFIITQADNHESKRNFLKRDFEFYTSFSLDSDTRIDLPMDNLLLLSRLQAWTEPVCFKNNNVSDYMINIDEEGNFSRNKLSLWDLFMFNISGIRKN